MLFWPPSSHHEPSETEPDRDRIGPDHFRSLRIHRVGVCEGSDHRPSERERQPTLAEVAEQEVFRRQQPLLRP